MHNVLVSIGEEVWQEKGTIMRKILLVALATVLAFALFILVGCGGSDSSADSGNSNSASETLGSAESDASESGKLNPPSWLVGSWTSAESGETIEVTRDNVVVGSGNLDFTWQIENVHLDVAESESGSTYTLAYTTSDIDFSYSFEQLSEDTMNVTIAVGDVSTQSTYSRD